jgi:hypothetical protein
MFNAEYIRGVRGVYKGGDFIIIIIPFIPICKNNKMTLNNLCLIVLYLLFLYSYYSYRYREGGGLRGRQTERERGQKKGE